MAHWSKPIAVFLEKVERLDHDHDFVGGWAQKFDPAKCHVSG
jgi:hypothetical protein